MVFKCKITETLVFNLKAQDGETAWDYLLDHTIQEVINGNKNLMYEVDWDEEILCETREDADIDITEEE